MNNLTRQELFNIIYRLGLSEDNRSKLFNYLLNLGSGSSDESIKIIPQELTEAQQMQARANQGLYRKETTFFDTLGWDGNIGDKEVFYPSPDHSIAYVKISEFTDGNLLQGGNVTINTSGVEETIPIEMVCDEEYGICGSVDGSIYIISKEIEGESYSTGLYVLKDTNEYTSKIVAPTPVFSEEIYHKIGAEFLPIGVSPTLTSGTKIADITIGDEVKALYFKDRVVPVVHTIPEDGFKPNIFYDLGSISTNKNIELAPIEDDAIYNEYMIQFTISGTPQISFDPYLDWGDEDIEDFEFESGKTYQISIVNDFACIKSYTKKMRPKDDGFVYCLHNITDISTPTTIFATNAYQSISDVYIDGEEVTMTSNAHQFNESGYHIVKFKMPNSSEEEFKFSWGIINGVSTLEEIYVPSWVKIIKSYAISECSNLKKIKFINTNNITTIESNAFAVDTNLIDIKLPISLVTLGSEIFRSCSNLIIESVALPNLEGTFAGFGAKIGLKHITDLGKITTIRENALGNNSENYPIETIVLPVTLESLGNNVFRKSNIKTITSLATTPPIAENETFAVTSNLEHIYVPAESVDAYKAASNWSDKTSIIEAIPSNS